MGEKIRYLLKNIGLMTLSNFASKIISFLLVPLYTSALSTTEYGTYDLYTTTAFLLIPVLSLCASDAVIRFALDEHEDKSEVFSIGLELFIRASFIIAILIAVNWALDLIPLFNEYPGFFVLYYMTCLLSDILTQFARGLERVFDVAIAGVLSSLVTVSLNIVLLVVVPIGLTGYFAASCAAFGITIVYLALRLQIWRYVTVSRSKTLKLRMERYSAPLIFNQIGWWINNASDRYVVTMICGAAANGIYSVAYKIPSLLSVFQTIFNQAWTLSVVKEVESNDTSFITKVYSVYNCGMVLLCTVLVALDRVVAHVLFANEFYAAWQYAPILLVSVVFSSLSYLLGGIFTATKDSSVIARTTVIGAVVNLAVSLLLTPVIGPMGAAIATLVSYIVVWVLRLIDAYRAVGFRASLVRDICSYCVLLLQSCVFLVWDGPALYLAQCFAVAGVFAMYLKEVKVIALRAARKG